MKMVWRLMGQQATVCIIFTAASPVSLKDFMLARLYRSVFLMFLTVRQTPTISYPMCAEAVSVNTRSNLMQKLMKIKRGGFLIKTEQDFHQRLQRITFCSKKVAI